MGEIIILLVSYPGEGGLTTLDIYDDQSKSYPGEGGLTTLDIYDDQSKYLTDPWL